MDENYISKKECEKRGYVHRPEGGYKKLTVLEKYAAKGWLDYGRQGYSSAEKLESGLRFYADFYKSHFVSGAVNLEAIRVDGGNSKSLPDYVLMARDRFFKALRCLSPDYVLVVTEVSLYDRELKIAAKDIKRYKHDLEVAKECLCCGLDELTEHYHGKPRFSKHKITGASYGSIWDDFTKYCNERGL